MAEPLKLFLGILLQQRRRREHKDVSAEPLQTAGTKDQGQAPSKRPRVCTMARPRLASKTAPFAAQAFVTLAAVNRGRQLRGKPDNGPTRAPTSIQHRTRVRCPA